MWPLSRQSKPKQMLNLLEDQTLFQETVNRLDGFITTENILVVTTKDQAAELRNEVPGLKPENFLLEPEPKGTASVVGIAALAVLRRDPDAVIAILPADHFIKDVNSFLKILEQGYLAAEKRFLVTISIKPTKPATGYGYIHRGEKVIDGSNLSVYKVAEFKEKPDQATAERYIQTSEYGWNSGMFIWRADVIMDEIKRYLPGLHDSFKHCETNWRERGNSEIDAAIWHGIEAQTVDYGIMEKSSRAVTIQAGDIGWSDIGDWNSLVEIIPADENGNTLNSKYINVNNSSEVVAYLQNPDKLIAIEGVSDLIIVDTGDALLVCKRSESQKVKEIVANLKRRGMTKFL